MFIHVHMAKKTLRINSPKLKLCNTWSCKPTKYLVGNCNRKSLYNTSYRCCLNVKRVNRLHGSLTSVVLYYLNSITISLFFMNSAFWTDQREMFEYILRPTMWFIGKRIFLSSLNAARFIAYINFPVNKHEGLAGCVCISPRKWVVKVWQLNKI